jgi:cysteine desulfurase
MAAAPIYLDHHASTPCDPKVVAAMAPLWNEEFANPSSRSHLPGLAAAGQVEQAREVMAASFGVPPESIVFTSGATEANNLAIKGLCEARMARGRHLITVATEHRAVLDPCRYLEKMGFGLTVLPVEADGLLDPARLEAALQPDTVLVSVMAANNEIGVLQPLAAIGALCRSHGAAFHCDAAQLVGHQQPQAGAGVDEGVADEALGEAVGWVAGRRALPGVNGAAHDAPPKHGIAHGHPA